MDLRKIFIILFHLCMIPVGIVMKGLATSSLWIWFVVPATGFKPLSIPESFGMYLLVQFFIYDANKPVGKPVKGDLENVVDTVADNLLVPAVWIIGGYLVTKFM